MAKLSKKLGNITAEELADEIQKEVNMRVKIHNTSEKKENSVEKQAATYVLEWLAKAIRKAGELE